MAFVHAKHYGKQEDKFGVLETSTTTSLLLISIRAGNGP